MANDVVAVLLPGQGYTLAHPLMHYAGVVAAEAGLRLLQVGYGDTTDVPAASIVERAAAEVVDGSRSASQVILIGKSLGTFVMSHLLHDDGGGLPVVAAAWLTPLIGNDLVYQAMRTFERPAAVVIGSRDAHFLPERLAALPPSTAVTSIDNADHSLEVAGDVDASVRALQTTVAALKALISEALAT
ncbi:MAG: hypothetical protein NVS3B21_28600 [Acidimicrobiales bacterium]